MAQPDADLLLQHRLIVLRVESPAMNEHDTPLPGGVSSGQEPIHDDFRFFYCVAMQVDMRLQRIITPV